MRRRVARSGAWLAAWALAALFFATQNQVTYAQYDKPPPFATTFAAALCTWLTWAPLAPVVVAMARRHPFARGRLWRAAVAHAAAAAVLVTAKLCLDAAARAAVFHRPPRLWPSDAHSALLTYAVVAAVVHVVELGRKARERELRASQLESHLAQARLEALEQQLQPHFLFNTLHAISALVHKDAARADRMISQLADLLRLSLDARGAQEVPLREELQFVERYLDIERTRFEDRLVVEYQIDSAVLTARVPCLSLQPLVENAVRHGIAPRAAPGRIVVRAGRAENDLRVEIADDGIGLRGPVREGVGLGNSRARLEQLYGSQARLTLVAGPAGGALATLVVPYAEAP
jgi:two-component system, LytTR family, sensor kinase